MLHKECINIVTFWQKGNLAKWEFGEMGRHQLYQAFHRLDSNRLYGASAQNNPSKDKTENC